MDISSPVENVESKNPSGTDRNSGPRERRWQTTATPKTFSIDRATDAAIAGAIIHFSSLCILRSHEHTWLLHFRGPTYVGHNSSCLVFQRHQDYRSGLANNRS